MDLLRNVTTCQVNAAHNGLNGVEACGVGFSFHLRRKISHRGLNHVLLVDSLMCINTDICLMVRISQYFIIHTHPQAKVEFVFSVSVQ